jgi:hypothetical protein
VETESMTKVQYPPARHRCRICKVPESLGSFYPDPTRPQGYSSRCIACDRSYQARWRKTPSGRASVLKSRTTPEELARKPARDAASYRRRVADGRMEEYGRRPDVRLRRALNDARYRLRNATTPRSRRLIQATVDAYERELARITADLDDRKPLRTRGVAS